MTDYISRSSAIEQIKEEWAKLPLSETTGFAILMRVLTKIPAADVREVVLCKNCKCYGQSNFVDKHMECKRFGCPVSGVDFCSFADMMEEQT